ncbi:MAG TPA: metallophosphoesterase, partial [Bacteroidota bacterium]|nr:metallophosphoesterase [Bacteroidota bacterium]
MYFSFQLLATVILLGIQIYFYRIASSAVSGIHSRGWLLAVRILFLLMSAGLIPVLLFRSTFSHPPSWLVYGAMFPFYLWHFVSFFLFLLAMVRMIIWMPVVVVRYLLHRIPESHEVLTNITDNPRFVKFDSRRRQFMRYSGAVIAGATISASAYGALRRNEYEITRMEVPIRNLPDEFLNTTITLISDIHSSIFMTKDQMDRYADVVNELQSEMIVVDGDFVNSMVEEVYPFAEAFSTLRAPMGVFGVLGNHDYYTRDVETVARNVNSCGIRLLRNSSV